MIIISNHLIGKMAIPEDAIIRINLAWIKNKKGAEKLLKNITHEIYLDYPSGRTKPPKPTMTLGDAIILCNEFKPKYFAISNAENPQNLLSLKKMLPKETELVPKIETVRGIMDFRYIIKETNIKTVMLDKEDLYTNDKEKYQELVNKIRKESKELGVHLLELNGVVFI